MHKKSPIKSALALFLVTLLGGLGTGAALWAESTVPYHSYTYVEHKDGIDSVPTAAAYEPDLVIPGATLVEGGLKSPQDMCYYDGLLYILDSGNKRVVILDQDYQLVRTLDSFNQDGVPIQLGDPQGIAIGPQGVMYLADQGNKAVYMCDLEGNVKTILERPDSDLIPNSVDFLPQKVLVDKNGILYVLALGIYQGALSFDPDGAFLGFFGSNKVSVTEKLLADRLWRMISTQEQKDKMIRYVPVEYKNFALGPDNFVYTVSNFEDDSQKGQVKKLNPLSANILWAGKKPEVADFGDLENIWTGRLEKSRLSAIHVDENEFINILDLERGRIFQYDQLSNLITIFGGKTDQQGSFRNPVALTTINADIVVLDEAKASLSTFKLTDLGRAIHEGTVLYNQGLYQEALEPWQRALKKESFSRLALRGTGRALERLGRYEEAMEYFRQAQTQGAYSDAFYLNRQKQMRENFGWLALAFLLVIAAPFVIGHVRRRNAKPEDRVYMRGKWEYPFYLLMHPFKGWEEFRHEKKGSLLIANLILASWVVMLVAQYQFTGFQFNFNRLEAMNILVLLSSTLFIFILSVVSNWAVATLQDGKGKMRDIWVFGSYAMLPRVLFAIPLIILTNVLHQGEGFFISLAAIVINLWTAVQVVMAVKAVQQYDMKRTLISLVFTAIGVILVILVIILFYSLFNQLFGFGQTVVQEIIMRT